MEKQTGLYITLLPDGRIKKILTDRTGEVAEFETTIEEDLMYYSDMLYEPYEKVLRSMKSMLQEDGTASLENSAKIFKLLNGMVQRLYKSNPTSGFLLDMYLAHTNGGVLTAGAMYYAFLRCLDSIAAGQVVINNALQDLALGIPLDIDRKYNYIKQYQFMESVVFSGTQSCRQYYFQMEVGYMIFLLMQFVERQMLIARCQCCGRFFVPLTQKTTLYCDRILYNGKTCKKLAPRMNHKVKAKTEHVVLEFDRAKQRMYKRYERALYDKKLSEKDLSYGEYIVWLDAATAARDRFLAREITEEEALAIIVVP